MIPYFYKKIILGLTMGVMSSAFLGGIFMSGSAYAEANSGVERPWKYEKTTKQTAELNSVKLYTRKITGQTLKQFKGVTVVDAPLYSVLSVLFTLDNHKNWIYGNKLSKAVYGEDGTPYMYFQIEPPGPTKHRDALMKATFSQEGNISRVVNRSVKNILPNQKHHIRMKNLRSEWIFEPLSENSTKVTFIGHADPGGWIPTWVANVVVLKMPKISLIKLQQQAKSPAFQGVDSARLAKEAILVDIQPLISQ